MRKYASLFFVSLLVFPMWSSVAAEDTTGITGDTIKIGLFGPLTSPSGDFAKIVYGVASIYKDANDRGGINGRKIELVIEDDGCDGQKTITAVKKLIEQDKVFMLHGGWCSSAVLAAKPEIAGHLNIPYMNIASASAAISDPLVPNIFQPAPTSRTISETIVSFALTKPGAKRIATVTQPDEGPNSKIRDALTKLKELKVTPVASVVLEKGITDATAQVRLLKANSPDVILVSLYPAELSVLIRDSYKEGLKTTFVATESASLEDTDKRVGIPEAMRDVYFFYPFADTLTSAKLSRFARIMKKYYPAEMLDMIGMQGIAGTLVVLEGLRRAGPKLSRERMIIELNNIKDFDTGIAASPISFSENNHSGAKSGNMITLVGRRSVVVSSYLDRKKPERASR